MLGSSYGNGYPEGGLGFNPFASVPAPIAGSLVAGADGVTLNRFGWADPDTGEVSNLYAPSTLFGLVLPQPFRYARNGWNLAYWSAGALILRAGQFVTLAAQGDFWVRFAAGASVGAQVFANPADGTAWAGNPSGFFSTPWTCMSYAPPGSPALISSWAKPF